MAVGASIISITAVAGLRDWAPARVATPALATLTVDSSPAGSDVVVDGQVRGVAPLTLSLAPGEHRVVLRRGSDERGGPLTLAAGSSVNQYFEFATEPAVPHTARLTIVSDPPAARVTIDGEARGTSPLTIGELTAGEHKVSVTSDSGTSERTVKVEAGSAASVVFSLPKSAAPAAGFLAIASPFDIRVLEGDTVIGVGRSTRIMVPTGRHTLSLVNEALQYQETRSIEVAAGKTSNVRVDAPNAPVSANARPWADVLVDGVSIGQTPISNLALPIGQHDVVFRNPQLGERRQTVVITARGPNRIAVDLTR
ncbi:MAG TPA: PEGA domain-containing protein [Vicinamibacterales bacterium]|nr:PEGA domain-containing protein [Vicinamibacterales bacterium]